METYNFFEQFKQLGAKDKISFNTVKGVIVDIEQVEEISFKLSIIIETKKYEDFYIQDNNVNLGIIAFNEIILQKENKKKMYIITKPYDFTSLHMCTLLNLDVKKEFSSLVNFGTPLSFSKALDTSEEKYDSNLFFYQLKKDNLITLISFEDLTKINFEVLNDFVLKETNKFFDKIEKGALIYIEDFLVRGNKIIINNFTSFYLADAEYLSKYFKNKYNKKEDYYKQKFFNTNNTNEINETKYLFIKIILIDNECIMGIDQYPRIYKIKSNQDKLGKEYEIYKFILIRDFELSLSDDNIYIITLSNKSKVYLFNNNLFESFINDLTVIYLNFIDFSKDYNYFQEIHFDKDFSFKILKNNEYIIFNYKNGNYNYYLPYEVKLKNNNNMDNFKFLLYYGLLNTINCFINYNGENKYSYEYFFYNYYQINKTPEITIYIEEKKYSINNYDHFNSQIRKRYIVINGPKTNEVEEYLLKKAQIAEKKLNAKNEKKKEESDKSNIETKINEKNLFKLKESNINIKKEENNIDGLSKNKIEEELKIDKEGEINEQNEIDDLLSLKQEIFHESLQFYFSFDKKEEKYKLQGIFNIEEIEPESNMINIDEKIIDKYEVFNDYYKIISEDASKEVEKLKKFKNDENIKDLVVNSQFIYPNMKYKNFIIYINICLFYYMNKTDWKDELMTKFDKTYVNLKKSKLSLLEKIRILKFVCKQFIISIKEFMNFDLLILNSKKNTIYNKAFNFNKKVISSLTEKSKLYLPFLQLDNFILFNYLVESNCYTLSMEPIAVTKLRLLSSYEPFFFISNEEKKGDVTRFACQCNENDITMINILGLFQGKKVGSIMDDDDNLVIPISMEFFREKSGHAKSNKNKRKVSPLYFYRKKGLIKLDRAEHKEIDKRGESGRVLEYFIKYKKNQLSDSLKTNFKYKEILNNEKYFTDINFEKLNDIIMKLTQNSETCVSESKKLGCQFADEKIEVKENYPKKDKIKIKEENETSLQYYEEKYLYEGKYFVYPHSVPIRFVPYGEEAQFSQGEIDFINKYKEKIKKGRKKHFLDSG